MPSPDVLPSLEPLDTLCDRLRAEDLDALRALRRHLLSIDILAASGNLTQEQIAVLHLTKRLLEDVWANLACDSTSDFPQESCAALLKEFCSRLGDFVASATTSPAGLSRQAIAALVRSVYLYYEMNDRLEDQLHSPTPNIEEEALQ